MVDLVAVNFTSNTAEGGGGVALIGTRGATVQGCSFHRNHGTDGGGIYSSSGLGTIINISESTFANNFAGVAEHGVRAGGFFRSCLVRQIIRRMLPADPSALRNLAGSRNVNCLSPRSLITPTHPRTRRPRLLLPR